MKYKIPIHKEGSGIHIKPENKGKFTDYCGGKVTTACIQKGKNSKNPLTRKRATFAANARTWKHKEGGIISFLHPLIEKFQKGKNILFTLPKQTPTFSTTFVTKSLSPENWNSSIDYIEQNTLQYPKRIDGRKLFFPKINQLITSYKNNLPNDTVYDVTDSKGVFSIYYKNNPIEYNTVQNKFNTLLKNNERNKDRNSR